MATDVTAVNLQVLTALLAESTAVDGAGLEALTGPVADGMALAGVGLEVGTFLDPESTAVRAALIEVLTTSGQINVFASVMEILTGRLPEPTDAEMSQYETITALRFGRDLVVAPDGTAVVPATVTGDWPVIAGRPNLHAALRRRIATTPGQMVHRPLYGAGAETWVGTLGDPGTRAAMVAALRDNLLRDTRLDDAQVGARAPDSEQVILDLSIRPTGEIDADMIQHVVGA